MDKISFFVPVRTVSELNHRDAHWAKAHRRHTGQKVVTRAMLYKNVPPSIRRPKRMFVTLIRYGMKKLDGDNLQGALKYVRDAIATHLGFDDGDARVSWRYGQEKSREHGVMIEIMEEDYA